MGSKSGVHSYLVVAPILLVLCATSSTWTQEVAQPHRTGKYQVRFSQRDPRSYVDEANRRFGEGVRFSPAACRFDHKSESYEVYVPETYDESEQFGLIVWINAGQGGGLPRGFQALMDKHRLIWIGANNAGNDRSPFWIRAMLAIDGAFNMKRLYNIDPDRVYVSGISGGGRTASMAALTFPDVFTGGGYYVIGCNYMKDVVTEGNRYAPGFWNKPDPRIIAVSKQRRYAMLTGSEDFNQPGTKRVYKGYKSDGFRHLTYLEEPGLGHRMPSTEWFEKGLVALDQPLVEAAVVAFESGSNAEKEGKHLEAFRSYPFAAAHGHGQNFYEKAKSKVAELKPKMAGLSEQALKDLGTEPDAILLRQFARTWFGYPSAKRAAEQANLLGIEALARMDDLGETARRIALQKFLEDWAGYNVFGQAIEALNKAALAELKKIRDVTSSRQQASKLKRFAAKWAPSPIVGLARLDFDNLATTELEQIKLISDNAKRRTKLIAFLKDFPDTQACTETVRILNSMQRQ